MNTEFEQIPPSNSMTYRDAIDAALHLFKRTLLQWPILVAFIPISAVAFYLVPFFLPPLYESSAVMLYREVIQTDAALGANAPPTESSHTRNARLREMGLSRATLLPIIASNGLYRNIFQERGELDALEEMRKATLCQVNESGAITISFRGNSPQQVFKVVKALVSSMTEQTRAYGVEQSQSTVAFLESQMATSTQELAKAEQSLAEFLSVHPEFALELSAQANQIGTGIRAGARERQSSDPLTAMQRQLEVARLQQRIHEATRQQVVSIAPAATSSVTDATTLNEAERELERAQRTLTERLAQYTDKHPDVAVARSQVELAAQRLTTVRQAISEQASSTPNSSAADGTTSSATEGSEIKLLRAEMNLLQRMAAPAQAPRTAARKKPSSSKSEASESLGTIEAETEWSTRLREVVSARERNAQLQRQLFRASLLAKVQASGGGQLIVIDDAYEPRRPVTRGKVRTGATGAASVFLLGLLTAVAFALKDDRLYGRRDVKFHGIGPIAHVIPLGTTPAREL